MFVELMPLLASRTVLITVARVGLIAYQEIVPPDRHRNQGAACLPAWAGMADQLLLDPS